MQMRKFESVESDSSKIHAVPLYSKLIAVFRDLIRQGKWSVGVALPSETDLARTYGVSVGTARKALESLQAEGLITRRQGRGTFVTDPVEQEFDRFCRIFLLNGGHNLFGSCEATTLLAKQDVATAEEASEMGVSRGAAVIRLDRRMDRNGEPALLEKQLLRADLFPGLQDRTDLPISLNAVFLRDFGIDILRCSENITAVNADHTVSEVLNVKLGAALLHTKRKIEDVDRRVVGTVERWFETQNAAYLVSST